VALLAASQAGLVVAEYPPAEVKRAVVGYGRAEKHQVQHMVTLLLGLAEPPEPFDASDALAVAICHVHTSGLANGAVVPDPEPRPSGSPALPRSWRDYKPATAR
jgi:crossover junction endodeoxyribonuclease RuvC